MFYKSQKSEIDTLLRARYPLIYIISYEEERIIRDIHEIEGKRKNIYYWTITGGLKSGKGNITGNRENPLEILNYILNYRSDGNSIFILLDFHIYFKDPSVQSAIKNLSHRLKQTDNNIIFISPVLDLPVEIDKDIKTIEYNLPSYEDIEKLFHQIFTGRNIVSEEDNKNFITSCRGLTIKEIERVMEKTFVLGEGKNLSIDSIIDEKKQIIRKTELLEFCTETEGFEYTGGLEKLKKWLLKRGKVFQKKDFITDQPKGVILIGPAGCGKSLIAKGLAVEWSLPLIKLDTGRLFSPLMGSSEENLRKAIITVEATCPAILWIDNADRGFYGVKKSTDSGVSSRLFGSFINWLQEKSSPVFVIATANSPFNLPPEFLRKGRFDEIFFLDLPDTEERKEIFKIYTASVSVSEEELETLACNSKNLSGYEIKKAVVSSLYDACEEGNTLSYKTILKNLNNITPYVLLEESNRLREWAKNNARKAS